MTNFIVVTVDGKIKKYSCEANHIHDISNKIYDGTGYQYEVEERFRTNGKYTLVYDICEYGDEFDVFNEKASKFANTSIYWNALIVKGTLVDGNEIESMSDEDIEEIRSMLDIK